MDDGKVYGPPFAEGNRTFRLKLDAARQALLDSNQFKYNSVQEHPIGFQSRTRILS